MFYGTRGKHIRDSRSDRRDKAVEARALESRKRAERKLGGLMQEQKGAYGTAQGKRTDLGPRTTQVEKTTLAEAGVDKPRRLSRLACGDGAGRRGTSNGESR
jgi:hypothetical protein